MSECVVPLTDKAVEVECLSLKIEGFGIRILHNGFLPPGFAIAMNEAGLQAFQRGEQPASCDAATIQMDAALKGENDE